MIRTTSVCICILAATMFSGVAERPQTYRNNEFGITLPIPNGVMLCPNSEDVHDHGPLMLLGSTNVKRCTDAEWGRYIEVFGMGNAADATKTLDKFFQSSCADPDTGEGECGPPPPDLQIPGMEIAAGTVKHANGWADIIVVTQGGKLDPAFDASVPSINYVIRLRVNEAHRETDLRIFRTVLQTIRLSPAR